nr:transposase, MuDR, MULE transposase domain protein [Tanacetum cinerariifolium]
MKQQSIVQMNIDDYETYQVLLKVFKDRFYRGQRYVFINNTNRYRYICLLRKVENKLHLLGDEWENFAKDNLNSSVRTLHFVNEGDDIFYVTGFNRDGIEWQGYDQLVVGHIGHYTGDDVFYTILNAPVYDKYQLTVSVKYSIVHELDKYKKAVRIHDDVRALLQKWYCARREKYQDSSVHTLSDWATHKVMDRMKKSANWKVYKIHQGKVYQYKATYNNNHGRSQEYAQDYNNNHGRSQEYAQDYTNMIGRSQEYEPAYTNNHEMSQEYEPAYTNNHEKSQEYEPAYTNFSGMYEQANISLGERSQDPHPTMSFGQNSQHAYSIEPFT